jgi:O-succinylbenzoate synthase
MLLGVELVRVRLPLLRPFRAAHGTRAVRESLLVRAVTSEAEGWGECVAPEEPTYTEEYLDGAVEVIRRFLLPALFEAAVAGGPATGWLARVAGAVRGHPMAKAAVEAALLDAELRAKGEPLASHLGGVRDAVDAGAAVGVSDSLGALLDEVTARVEEGYVAVKLKIAPHWDVVPVAAVRERFPDLPVSVDANGTYSLADEPALRRLDGLGLTLIEQPLPPDDLLGHAELTARLATPVCLDESATSVGAVAAAVRLGACRAVNVKAARIGGLREARRMHDLCTAAGVDLRCGGMLETGVGRAAAVALASLPGFTLVGDLSASNRYFERDLTRPFVLEDGRLRVPSGPGIGVEPLSDALASATVWREWVGVG